jgi:signal transduction histidine kinase/DNA-binding response OmpR family regulator
MRKTCILIIVISLSFSTALNAQQQIIDSLKQLVPQSKEDTNKVLLLGDIAYYLYNLNPGESFEYGKKTLELAQKIGFGRGVINGYYKMCIARYGESDYEDAKKYALLALEKAEELEYGNRMSPIFNILGIIAKNTGDYEEAIKWGFEAEKIARQYGEATDVAIAISNIGSLYLELSDTINAKKYLLDAVDLMITQDEKLHLVELYSNLVHVEADDDKKFEYLINALNLAEETDYVSGLVYNYQSLGNFYRDVRQDFANAKQSYYRALNYVDMNEDQYQKASICIDFGNLLMQTDQLDSASLILEEGLELAKGHDFRLKITEAKKMLSKIYALNNDHEQAYTFLEESYILSDSLYNENIAEELAIANSRFESEKKESQIIQQQLEIERQTNIRNRTIYGGLVLALLGSVIFVVLNSRHKRKRKEAELAFELEHAKAENLENLDQLKSEFFTNISHELRTPLTLITGPLEIALKKSDNRLVRKELELAHSNSKRLLNLINEIMDLSRLQEGKLKLNESSVNLHNLVRRIFFSFHSLANIHQLEMDFDFAMSKDLNLNVDVEKFEKVLNNLISNAIKYSDPGGKIKLRTISNGDYITLSVIDKGQGIPEDELPYIFNRYYQSSHGTSSIQGGVGVGLTIANELTKLFGGTLSAESEVGQGSIFTLTFPIKEPVEKVTDAIEEDSWMSNEEQPKSLDFQPLLLNGEQPKVLIVEDNQDMLSFLKQILSPHFICSAAVDGVEALRLIQTESFDLVLSDVMMPRMDGFTLKEKVNSLPGMRQVPFIMLTARVRDEDKLEGLNLGVDDYITKPFSTGELLARMKNALGNKMERENWLKKNLGIELFPDPLDSTDQKILKEAERSVLSNLAETDFKVGDLARSIGYGERQLRRVIKSLTGFTPVGFILEIRLLKAFQLLEKHQYLSVSEVRDEVGIESPSYFTTKFKDRFGINPKELLS